MDGIVKQLDQFGGVVIECTCSQECMKANPDISQNELKTYTRRKTCLLSVDHGDRCLAYPQDSATFLIDTDTTRIKRIPTPDNVKRI